MLTSMNKLALLLHSQGKLDEAEALFRQTLEARRRTLREEHPDTLESMNDLALLLKDQGKLDEAEPLFRETLEARRRTLGEEHPDTLTSVNNLAVLLKILGELDEAEPLLRQALEAQHRILGEKHPNTLQSMNNLASLLWAQGKLAEAERLGKRVVVFSGKTLAEGDWRRGLFHTTYGAILTDLMRHEEAERQLLKGYQAITDSLGPRDQRTRGAIQKLVDLYTAWGKPEKAEEYRKRLESSKESEGEK